MTARAADLHHLADAVARLELARTEALEAYRLLQAAPAAAELAAADASIVRVCVLTARMQTGLAERTLACVAANGLAAKVGG